MTFNTNSFYRPATAILVRVPVFPLEKVNKETLENASQDALFRRALMLASPTLDEALERGEFPAAANRYWKRMGLRTTPFGLFASVCLAHWGDSPLMRLRSPMATTRSRVDGAWYAALVETLEREKCLRRVIRWYWHEGVVAWGNDVVLDNGESSVISIPRTNALIAMASIAVHGAYYEELIACGAAASSNENLESLFDILWRNGFLVSELRHDLRGDPMPRLQALLNSAGLPISEVLARLQVSIDAVDSNACYFSVEMHRALEQSMRNLVPGHSGPCLQIDAAADLEHPFLPPAIGESVCDAVTALLKLSDLPNGCIDIEDYRCRFLERFGQGVEVPLLELIDPLRGLGVPNPAPDYDRGLVHQGILLRLAADALRNGSQVVELTDELVEALTTNKLSRTVMPRSIDVKCMLGARSGGALRSGEYRIILATDFYGASAGRHFGRFADLLGSACDDVLTEIADAEQSWDNGELAVELAYPPRDSAHLNVCSRTLTRPFAATYGVPPAVPMSRRVLFKDIMVRVCGNEFCFRWAPENVDLRPAGWHAYNPQMAPEPVRFFFNAYAARGPVLTPFPWGVARHLQCTPRVVRGRVVVCPANWSIEPSDSLVVAAAENRSWNEALALWCEEWSVPRWMRIGKGDKQQALNLCNAEDQEALRRILLALPQGERLILSEVLPEPADCWLEGPDGHHACEIIVPILLQGAKKRTSPHNAITLPPNETWIKHPGSEWLSLELGVPPARQESLIAGPLSLFARSLVSQKLVEQWFYVRYLEADRHHVRFRLQGDPVRLCATAMPAVSAFLQNLVEMAWISDFEYRTYSREIGRYGGDASLRRIEDLFCADSDWTSELLDFFRRRRLTIRRESLVAWSAYELIRALGLAEPGSITTLRSNPVDGHNSGKIYRADQDFLLAAFSGHAAEWMGALSVAILARNRVASEVGMALREMFKTGAGTKFYRKLASNIIHMHCNRFLGVDREAEGVAMRLVERTLRGLSYHRK